MKPIGRLAPRSRPRRGFFLIVVLVVVAVATLAAYSYTETMLAYDEATHLSGDEVQTRAAAESGIEMTRRILAQPTDIRDSSGGILSNPNLFQAITIVSPEEDGRAVNFSIVAPGMDETGRLAGVRFGLQNESAKLNINALIALEKNSALLMPAMSMMGGPEAALGGGLLEQAGAMADSSGDMTIGQSLLMTLPGMSIDVADAILDWLDDDDEPRPFGAEVDHYSALPTPYAPKNGPIESVEELLLVRGVTPDLLFGVDANRNGVIDAAEQQSGAIDIGSVSALGWASYLTVHGQEANRRRDGTPRININQEDLELLADELATVIDNADYSSFILAYRIGGQSAAAQAAGAQAGGQAGGGPSGGGGTRGGGGGEEQPQTEMGFSDPGGQGRQAGQAGRGGQTGEPIPWTADAADQLDLTGGSGTNFSQLLDLIDATVTIGQGDTAQAYRSPFTSDPIDMALYMPVLMESLTTHNFEKMPGRININECPVELLYGIPSLDAESADAIIEARGQQTESENRLYETWPLVEGLITLETMRAIMPLVTAGGDVYRAQIIGYHETAASSTRLEVVIDATGVNPKVIQYRDLSHLGRGFDLTVLGIRHFIPDGN
jgi:hypothetical protein